MRRPFTASSVAFVSTTILLASTMHSVFLRSVGAWSSRHAVHRCSATAFRTSSSALYSTEKDEYGRRIRTGGSSASRRSTNENRSSQRSDTDDRGSNDAGGDGGGGGWGDYDTTKPPARDSQPAGRSSDGWDDFDPFASGGSATKNTQPRKPPSRTGDRRPNSPRGGGGREGGGREGGGSRTGGRSSDFRRSGRSEEGRPSYGGGRDRDARGSSSSSVRPPRDGGGGGGDRRMSKNNNSARGGEQEKARQINMNALSGAGFDHLYGLSSVLNALEANRRDFSPPEQDLIFDGSEVRINYSDEDDNDNNQEERLGTTSGGGLPERKPEAQFKPWLFVQERGEAQGGRSTAKASSADQVTALAEELGLPVAEVDKGVLNTLSGNRPHQGFVLRCGKIEFEQLSRIPHPKDDPSAPSVWLVLDEVVDPQNLGALLRSAFFLGGTRAGILVCSKNSAPPSPVVSAASAGALELMEVYSTSNLPRTLNNARDDGFRIVGASSSVPRSSVSDNGDEEVDLPPLYELQQLPPHGAGKDDKPVLLVLGSEGHGLRTLVAKACSEFVRIPSGEAADGELSSNAGVDSLNVSVTGGILLWHLLHGVTRSP